VKAPRIAVRGVLALAALGLAIQAVPYGRPTSNPAVLREPKWDSPHTRELFFRTCKNCHSNETEWPRYAAVAPAAWLVRWDVDKGRSHFNASEWGRARKNHGDEAAQQVREDEMPPWYYRPLHPECRLSEQERRDLVAGLVATFGDSEDAPEHEH
jgi:mono/diheme cytochrome c family protein